MFKYMSGTNSLNIGTRHRGKNDDRQCSYVGKNVRV